MFRWSNAYRRKLFQAHKLGDDVCIYEGIQERITSANETQARHLTPHRIVQLVAHPRGESIDRRQIPAEIPINVRVDTLDDRKGVHQRNDTREVFGIG